MRKASGRANIPDARRNSAGALLTALTQYGAVTLACAAHNAAVTG
jgi:hypothetical protein